MKAVSVPMSSVASGFTVQLTVSGIRTWRVRFWIGEQLIRLGVRVMGMHCSVAVTD